MMLSPETCLLLSALVFAIFIGFLATLMDMD